MRENKFFKTLVTHHSSLVPALELLQLFFRNRRNIYPAARAQSFAVAARLGVDRIVAGARSAAARYSKCDQFGV